MVGGTGGATSQSTKVKFKAKITLDELVVTADKGKSEKFKRESPPPGTPKPSNPEEVVRSHLAAMKELTATLQGIKDEATYKAALPSLEKTVKRIQDLTSQLELLELGPEEGKKLLEKFPDFGMVFVAAEQARIQAAKQVPGKAEELDDLLFKAGLARKSFGPPKAVGP
jgi:hypothetical protein